MTETAARSFLDFVVSLNKAFTTSTPTNALRIAAPNLDIAGVIARISSLSNQTTEELERARFTSDDRRSDMLGRVALVEKSVINALAGRGGANATGPLISEVTIEKLRGVVEQVEEKEITSVPSASREDMMLETEILIKEVKGWELEDYAKKTLLLQLESIQRIIQASDHYSSSDLRGRVKSVIADFAAEFAVHDKQHQRQLERIIGWAKRGFFAGTNILGLTADASSVAGLLPPPS